MVTVFVEHGNLGLPDRDGVAVGDAGSAGAVGIADVWRQQSTEVEVMITSGRHAMSDGD